MLFFQNARNFALYLRYSGGTLDDTTTPSLSNVNGLRLAQLLPARSPPFHRQAMSPRRQREPVINKVVGSVIGEHKLMIDVHLHRIGFASRTTRRKYPYR